MVLPERACPGVALAKPEATAEPDASEAARHSAESRGPREASVASGSAEWRADPSGEPLVQALKADCSKRRREGRAFGSAGA